MQSFLSEQYLIFVISGLIEDSLCIVYIFRVTIDVFHIQFCAVLL